MNAQANCGYSVIAGCDNTVARAYVATGGDFTYGRDRRHGEAELLPAYTTIVVAKLRKYAENGEGERRNESRHERSIVRDF